MNIFEISWLQIGLAVGYVNKRCGRLVGDRGEGVISTAIAVLIVAGLGALMWTAFQTIWSGAETDIKSNFDFMKKEK